MITIENLTVSYKKGISVIDSLNLVLSEGTINGIVGLNGAGKTTLLNSIYGLKRMDSGTIKIDDRKLSKKEVSFLETENFFYSNITGSEYLGLFTNTRFDDNSWNALFGLPLGSIIDNYSSGMKKKLAIMGILKQDKPIMILDEPFNGLDIETCRIIRQLLLKLKERKKTIIITSHIIETLTNLCDFIHYLEHGKIRDSRDKSGFSEFARDIFESIENKNAEVINSLIDTQ
jgi:ABC-2 type transport system ATP-binding protein